MLEEEPVSKRTISKGIMVVMHRSGIDTKQML